VEAAHCRHRSIVRHFDEEIGSCGASCDICRGVSVAERVARAKPGRTVGRRASGGPAGAAAPGDEALFEQLRVLRKEIADRSGVPAYIVFGDRVLREMAAQRPGTPAALLEVPGVGPAKLDRYGAAFLDAIARS
jgi:ATP-dependent DNA helicase RecQ